MVRKYFGVMVFALFYFTGQTQKVGIGTNVPSGKLTVAGTDTMGNELDASIEIRNLASTNTWILRAGAENTATPPNGFSIGDNVAYRLAIDQFGRIGISTLAPRAMMEVYGNSYLGNPEGAQLLLFENEGDYARLRFANSLYNAATHNKYWDIAARTNTALDGTGDYMQFYKRGLGDILTLRGDGNVGIGVSNPAWKLDVNGSMRLNGRFYVNGTSGVTGQILTSNGLGVPYWQTLSGAFQNTVRFEASFIESSNNLLTPPIEYAQYLNTSPADVTISASSITINKSGLYHIEGYSEYNVVFNNIPALFAQKFLCTIDGRSFVESNKENVPRDPQFTTPAYTNFGRFSHEVYVNAPGTISVSYSNSYSSSGGTTVTASYHRGRISGYLISE
jgi:hypothetical protein